ncbi:MAG: cell division protein ZapA [Chromatiales bacterium]|nr:cell division protein ZapA [Chromatiales bacterium]
MSASATPITVFIMGKEYRIACPDDERSSLLASASLLDQRMQEIRDGGRVIGADRIAVMAALNLTHEMLQMRAQRENAGRTLAMQMRSLQDRIEDALEQNRQMEL